MKRIILSIFLLFTLAYTDSLTPTISSDSEVGKWRSFFGVEGGVGYYDFAYALFATGNPLLAGKTLASTLGYSVGILGGWQRYDYEKVGIRHTFGVKYDWGYDMGKFGGNEQLDYRGNDFYIFGLLYYAIDGLFDLVKTSGNRFGINLGISFDFNMNYSKNEKEGNKLIGGGGIIGRLRLGVYTQVENNIFDCILSFPTLGIGFGEMMMPSTLTLGYKYLF